MSLYPKAFNTNNAHPIYVDFDKNKIIEEIKQRLPNPWVWYTMDTCMDEVDNPGYDLIIMRNKEVNEKNVINRPFQQVELMQQSLMSIVLGIYVVDTFSISFFIFRDNKQNITKKTF